MGGFSKKIRTRMLNIFLRGEALFILLHFCQIFVGVLFYTPLQLPCVYFYSEEKGPGQKS